MGRRNREDDSPDTRISKKLSSLLRHRATANGLALSPDGFARVSEILALPQFASVSAADLYRVAAADAKHRFLYDVSAAGGARMRANQGHTLECVESTALLRRVDAADAPSYDVCVHGTGRDAWGAIARDGLRRMARNHVHFARGLPGESGVVSGMRSSAEVLIYVDVVAAVRDGVPFFLSTNDVLLSPGVDFRGNVGVVPPAYFARVVDRATGRDLLLCNGDGAGTDGCKN